MVMEKSVVKKLVFYSVCAALFWAGAGFAASTAGNNSWFAYDAMLLGGHFNGKWVAAKKLMESDRIPYQGQPSLVYGPGGLEGRGEVARVLREEDRPFPSTDGLVVKTDRGREFDEGSARLAMSGGWNAVPRQPLVMSPDNGTYRDIVRKYLERHGLPGVNPQMVQLMKVDLEGDGVDEIIICAQNIVPANTGAFNWDLGWPLVTTGMGFPTGSYRGNYSLVLLRKIVNGQVREIPLVSFIALKDGTPEDAEQVSPPLAKVCQLADLDGDGVLEIIVANNYYEGYAYEVFAIKGGEAVRVLDNGAGV